jgi:hypothetical protein
MRHMPNLPAERGITLPNMLRALLASARHTPLLRAHSKAARDDFCTVCELVHLQPAE